MDDFEFQALLGRAGSLDALVTVATLAGLRVFARQDGDPTNWRRPSLQAALGDQALRSRVDQALMICSSGDEPPGPECAARECGNGGVVSGNFDTSSKSDGDSLSSDLDEMRPADRYLTRVRAGLSAVPSTAWQGFSVGHTVHDLFAVAEDAEPTSAAELVCMLQESAWPANPFPQRRFHPVH